MFRNKNLENETDEQIIANMERLQKMQENGYSSYISWAIVAMAKRLERRNQNSLAGVI